MDNEYIIIRKDTYMIGRYGVITNQSPYKHNYKQALRARPAAAGGRSWDHLKQRARRQLSTDQNEHCMRKGVRLLWVADSGMHVIAAGEEELDQPWDNIHYYKFDFEQRGLFFSRGGSIYSRLCSGHQTELPLEMNL